MPVSYFTARNSYYGDCACLVVQSCPAPCNPMGCSQSGTTVHGIFQARILSGLPFSTPRDLPDTGIEPTSPESPAFVGRFFTTVPPVKTRIPKMSTISNYLSAGKSKRNVKLQSKDWLVSQKDKNQISWIFNKIIGPFIYSSNWISTQALWCWHFPILYSYLWGQKTINHLGKTPFFLTVLWGWPNISS